MTARPRAGILDEKEVPAMKKIVLAYDGSEQSRHALATAAELCRNGTDVVVVTVAEPLTAVAFDTVANPFSEEEQRDFLAEAEKRLTGLGKHVSTVAPVGDAVEEIVRVAREQGAELIVIGSRGHGRLGRMLLGSASRGVLARAPCNVLVVR
jgi:nucleotide-binding universal stress UspA family protein